jgi:hypothetical protein
VYLEILNDNMVGYANISARDMLYHLFKTYGKITAVDLEINFEHMRRAWDPQQPVESVFKQIQDCAEYSKAGGRPHWAPATNQLWLCKNICNRSLHERMSSVERETCHWKNLDTIQISLCCRSLSTQANAGRIRCTAGYHSTNAAFSHNEDQMAEATIGALANIATATAADWGVVADITHANARLAKHLEENSNELRELKALLKR